ncbi:MAG: hypothetical protein HRF45_07695 [Fimbriimonadia bacterium]|jgi:hypothetical protein
MSRIVAGVCLACFVPSAAFGDGATPAYTLIPSSAKVEYSYGVSRYRAYSLPTGSLVEQVYGLAVEWESFKNLRSYLLDEYIDIGFTLKNTGNGRDYFQVGFGSNAENWVRDSGYPVYGPGGRYDLSKPTLLDRNQSISLRLQLKAPNLTQMPFGTSEGMDGFRAALSAHSQGSVHAAHEQGLVTWWREDVVLGRQVLYAEKGWWSVCNQAFGESELTAIAADATGLYLAMSNGKMYVMSPDWSEISEHTPEQKCVLTGRPTFSGGYLAAKSSNGGLFIAHTTSLSGGVCYVPPGEAAVSSDPAPLTDGFAVLLSNGRLRKVSFDGAWGPSFLLPGQAATPPVAYKGLVYVGLQSGAVVCVGHDMRLHWVSHLWQGPLQFLAPGPERFLVFATTTNRVGVLDLDARMPFWVNSLPSSVLAICSGDRGVYALCSDRMVHGFQLATGASLIGYPTRKLPGETEDLAHGIVAIARSTDTPEYVWAATRAPLGLVGGNVSDASLFAFCGNLGINLYGVGREPQVETETIHEIFPPVVLPFGMPPLIAVAVNGRLGNQGKNWSWVYVWRPDFKR